MLYSMISDVISREEIDTMLDHSYIALRNNVPICERPNICASSPLISPCHNSTVSRLVVRYKF